HVLPLVDRLLHAVLQNLHYVRLSVGVALEGALEELTREVNRRLRNRAVIGVVLHEPHAFWNPKSVPNRLRCPSGERFARSPEVTPCVDPMGVAKMSQVPWRDAGQQQMLVERHVIDFGG